MPTWVSYTGDRVTLPNVEDVSDWERVLPGLASEMLMEVKIARRHTRALQWAQVFVDSLPSTCKLVAVVGIWQMTDSLSAHGPAAPIVTAGVAAIAAIVSGRWPAKRPPQKG